MTLDLTGLPPSPEEVDAFTRDREAKAYERLVDRLMDSTAYAERRAQVGSTWPAMRTQEALPTTRRRSVWPWRDWVIWAIDQNMPFDQFTIEQLAGDMLADPTPEQLLATGFHRNAPQAGE